MNDKDVELFGWVKKFNSYDLYSKAPVKPDVKALMPYYTELVAKYLPDTLKF
jgi:inositol oxygenase